MQVRNQVKDWLPSEYSARCPVKKEYFTTVLLHKRVINQSRLGEAVLNLAFQQNGN